MSGIRFSLFLIIGAATVAAYIWLFPSPESQIRASLLQISQSMAIEGKESPLKIQHRSHKIAKLFSKSPSVDIRFEYRGPFDINTRQDIQDYLMLVRKHLHYLKLEIDELIIVKNNDGSYSATFTCKAHFSKEPGHTQSIPFLFEFRKDEGSWLIHKARNKSVIEL